MGAIYELVSTPVVYVRKMAAKRVAPERTVTRVCYGEDPHQSCMLYEPARPAHASVVMYFHGGGYLVGTPESMEQVADVFNAHGYRFVSVGFGLMPKHPFPGQIDDAFNGISAAIDYLEERGVSCESIVVAGSSAGGHAAALVAYARGLQAAHGFNGGRITGLISLAGVMDIDDMLARALPLAGGTARFVRLPGMVRSDRASVHAALVPYSPIQVIDEHSTVPMLVLHGIHDKMSPYPSQVRFVEKLNGLTGTHTAVLHSFSSWWCQHIVLTAGLFSEDPRTSEGLQAIFSWMDDRGL